MTATQTPEASPAGKRRNTRRIVAVGVLLVAVAIGGFLWWFFQDDAPDEVSLEGAAAQVADAADDATDDGAAAPATAAPETAAPATAAPATETPATSAPTAPATTAAATAGTDVSGTWNVDTTIGEFSYEDSTGTFVGFRVAEELAGIGSVDAVGRTPDVSGSLTIDGTTLTAVTIEANMASITTDDSRRDDRVLGALDTDQFPTATFVLTEPVDLGPGATTGEPLGVDAVGELTIRDVTQSVVFPLQAQLVNDTIVVVGQLEVVFADYGVSVPSAPIVLSAEDRGPIELQLFFTR
jgi:polyisoprenoid-binding protein YceI